MSFCCSYFSLLLINMNFLFLDNEITVITRSTHAYDTVWIQTELKHFSFQVKTCKDAHVILSRGSWYNGSFYEIVFGSQNNQITVLRKSKSGPNEAQANTPGILSCDNFVKLWVSWYNVDVISVGKGAVVGEQTILSYQDPSPMIISAVSLSSWNEVSGVWKFYRDAGMFN